MGLDCPLGEHICLAVKLAVLIQHFQRAQKVIAAVIGKSERIAAGVDKAVFAGKFVIERIQPVLCL